MPQKRLIEYAEGYVRDIHSNGESVGRFTIEIDKFLGKTTWFMTSPGHLTFNLIPEVTAEDVGRRVKVLIELEETVDTEAEA